MVLRDSATLCPDISATISEVSETRTGQQTTKRAKQHSKLEAIRILLALDAIGENAAAATGNIGDDEDPPFAEGSAP